MTRRLDLERIYDSRRAAQLSILTSIGVPQDRAEAYVTDWELHAVDEGRQRHTECFWRGATDWIAARRDRRL